MKLFLYAFLTFALASPSSASAPDGISTEEFFSDSVAVAAVLIEKAEMINVGEVRCGARYTVRVLVPLKGVGSQLVFDSTNGLEIGGEYVFFFKRHEERSHLNSNPEQIKQCPPPISDITPATSRGIIKLEFQSGRAVFEVLAGLTLLPESLQVTPPHRYNSDADFGTVWIGREEYLAYLRSIAVPTAEPD